MIEDTDDVSLMELLLRGRIGNMVRKEVARKLSVSDDRIWRNFAFHFMAVTMEILYRF